MLKELLIFLLFILHASFASADIVVIKLSLLARDFPELSEVDEPIKLDVILRSPEQEDLWRSIMELKAGNGIYSGNTNVASAPTESAVLCYEISDDGLRGNLLIYETCEPVSLDKTLDNSVYSDRRMFADTNEYYNHLRQKIHSEIIDNTSSDTSLFLRDADVINFLAEAPTSKMGTPEARLISSLIDAAARVGTRLPSTQYFEITDDMDREASRKVRELILKNRSVEGNTNPAKILFTAFTKIDLTQYAAGRPRFKENFFRSLSFLAIERAKIARENGLSGATVAKEFSTFCKDLGDHNSKTICLQEFLNKEKTLIDDAFNLADEEAKRDLRVALSYIYESASDVGGFRREAQHLH